MEEEEGDGWEEVISQQVFFWFSKKKVVHSID